MRFLIIALALLSRPRFVTDMYPTAGVITEVNRETDTVTFTDATGDAWSFSGTEDWMEGDTCAAIMDKRGTDTIYDDAVVVVRYCG